MFTITLLNQQASHDELDYAMNNLQLNGVCLFTNYHWKYAGDKYFDPFFAVLNRRKAVEYIQPTDPGPQFDAWLDRPYAQQGKRTTVLRRLYVFIQIRHHSHGVIIITNCAAKCIRLAS